MRTAVRWVLDRIPTNLAIFISAIYLSNGVSLFTKIYGNTALPPRYTPLLFSCISSLLAAGLWTALAAKTDRIEKAVAYGSRDPRERQSIRENLWNDVWIRMASYLGGAIVLSLSALLALVIRE